PALERLRAQAIPGESPALADFEVPPFESLEALRGEIKLERRRGSCCRAEPTQKVPLVEESLLRFFLAPVARKSPAKVVSRSPARPGHVRLSANYKSTEPRSEIHAAARSVHRPPTTAGLPSQPLDGPPIGLSCPPNPPGVRLQRGAAVHDDDRTAGARLPYRL